MTTYISILRGINLGGHNTIKMAIYLYCRNGYGKTKLSNKFPENKLKVVATTRN
jgi:uncharacterized protein (DUF1697 family)